MGLLGGSFNPAHSGHLHIAQEALRFLRLNQVWLMVSPGNPLKSKKNMAPFFQRLESAEKIADGKRIVATDIEYRLRQRFTVKTIAELIRRFPNVEFVWLMGADGLANFTRWKHWRKIVRLIPIAVFPRPENVIPALHSAAASALKKYYRPSREAYILARQKPPAWTFLVSPQMKISSTQIREAGGFCFEGSERKRIPPPRR
ncbi:nicotinate-nucleotide adenylyltransferase [Swingsia samuiensis]|uniref:nicotinate-nucleotide adenylyltransferase n=1 Tax=Swingsia samuiensis TaxID=1293412 RepID=UPI0038CFA09D